jgi:hypothetical protein
MHAASLHEWDTIGANISTVSQVIGSSISNFALHCSGSETNPVDCLMVENQGSDSSHNTCQRTIIQCFITDPDPQFCNISLSTAPPEYKIPTSVIDASIMTPAITSTIITTTEAPSNLSLVGYATVPNGNHKDSSNIDVKLIMPIVGTTTMVVVLIIFFALTKCFVVRRRRKADQKSQIERSKRESHTIVNDSQTEYAVITECNQEGQRQDMERVYKYTQNDAYDSKAMHTNSLWPSGDKQQAIEPIYETIPGPILKNQTTK